jgi:small subunit ribosomal protein S20
MAKRTASARKQARAGVRRAARNRGVKSEVKTRVTKARRSFTESPVASSERAALALDAVRSLDRAASKGILHPKNAARRKGRIMRQLVKVGGVEAPPTTRAKGKKATPAPAPAPAPAAPAKKGRR